MIITCENCETSFNLNEKLLKPKGSKVRCSRCKHVFTAYPPVLPELDPSFVETVAPEETEEKVQEVDVSESDSTFEASEENVPEETEDDLPAEDAGDVTQGIEESVAEEVFGDEAVSDVTDEMDASLDDLDMEFDIDTVSEEDTLEDLDLDLDLDEASEEATPSEEDTATENIDLSDIDLSMDTESGSEAQDDEEELDLELDLDMDSELETDAVLTEAGDDLDSEELDFSDFEETVMLDSPPKPEPENLADDSGEELELDLDLDDLEMADEEPPDAESALSATDKTDKEDTDKEDLELEDLDFELDMELEGDAAEVTADEGGEDVDLSDIEKMLDGGGEEFETISLGPDLGDAETEVEKWKESPEDDELMDQTAEIDLSDIMIDVEDDEIEEDIEDMELDLDIDEASAARGAMGGKQKPEEIDISGFEEFDIPEEGDQVQSDFSGGDIELEFEVDEDTDDLDGMATASDFDEIGADAKTIAYSEPLVDVVEAPTKKKEKKKKVKKIKTARKSGILRPIVVLLILLILPLAAIVLLDKYMDINVPYVTDYLKQVPYLNQVMKSEMKIVGEIRVDNISSKFIDNTKHGKLFVITGTLKNEFPESRKYIRVRGSLFSSGKVLAKDVTIYGGNVISDLDLAEMSLTDINKRLSNRFGDKKSNFDVKPGRAIPFMVVFSDLPESLEEFTIEAAGSFPVTTQQ